VTGSVTSAQTLLGVADLIRAGKTLRLDRIFAQVDWAGPVEESVARYATEIAPALRAA
jgi:hypothetical protein